MAQRQWLTSDTSKWLYAFGPGDGGAYAPSTGTDALIDSACTGTINTDSLPATNISFAAGQLILIYQTRGIGAGQWELNKIESYTAGTITTVHTLIHSYTTGAQVLVVPSYLSGLIDTGVTITAKAWNGTTGGIYAKFCKGTFTIAGTLTGAGKGFLKDINGVLGEGQQGEGTTGAGGTTSTLANGNGGGGGDGGGGNVTGAGGGGGGNGAAGSMGQINQDSNKTPGAGGNQVGNTSLTSLNPGGGGGSGAGDGQSITGADGATGGAILLLIAKTIIVTGAVSFNGNDGSSAAGIRGGGGGGGGGGSCLLKGQTITLGSALITAIAGVGGTANNCRYGGAGGTGRIHVDYSGTISGTTTPTLDSTLDKTIRPRGEMVQIL